MMRKIRGAHVDACDTRIEVVSDSGTTVVGEYSASEWIEANLAYGRIIGSGLHARLVSVGLADHVISEAFGVMDESSYHVRPCPACGETCVGHGNDPTGRRIVADHWSGNHQQCHPDGCTEGPGAVRSGVRTRERREG